MLFSIDSPAGDNHVSSMHLQILSLLRLLKSVGKLWTVEQSLTSLITWVPPHLSLFMVVSLHLHPINNGILISNKCYLFCDYIYYSCSGTHVPLRISHISTGCCPHALHPTMVRALRIPVPSPCLQRLNTGCIHILFLSGKKKVIYINFACIGIWEQPNPPPTHTHKKKRSLLILCSCYKKPQEYPF